MHPCVLIIRQTTLHHNICKIFYVLVYWSNQSGCLWTENLRLFHLHQFWSMRKQILFQTVQSTNPLTEEEHNFLDHIEQKIHQQAAKNAEDARQRQVWAKPSISSRSFFELLHLKNSFYSVMNHKLWFIFQIKHEKDMKALHERLERERIEREKKHAQQQADLQAQLARDLAPLRRPCFPFC